MAGVASVAEAVGVGGLRRKMFAAIHAKLGGAIRILIVGGAAPNPEISKGMRGFGFTLLQGYGLTETSPIVALNRLRKFRDDAAGLPLPNLEVRIEDADDEGRGEIVVRGPSVMLGYYKNEDATRQVLKDGWFHTGDYGTFDADGFLHVSGRKKNVIVAANGKNVFPEELEDQVNAIPLVLESVVYGARGPAGDEEISVMIVPNAETVYEHGAEDRRRDHPRVDRGRDQQGDQGAQPQAPPVQADPAGADQGGGVREDDDAEDQEVLDPPRRHDPLTLGRRR